MRFLVTLCIIALATNLQAQLSNTPKVFTLGESEQAYEGLNQSYSKTLLEATNGDIKLAFQRAPDTFALPTFPVFRHRLEKADQRGNIIHAVDRPHVDTH